MKPLILSSFFYVKMKEGESMKEECYPNRCSLNDSVTPF